MKFVACAGAVAVAGLSLLGLESGEAAAQEKMRACTVGQKVLTPGGKPSTVVKIYGTGGCTVKDDATGLESSWAAFTLTPAPGSPAPKTAALPKTPANGAYQCSGGASAGNMKLSFGPGSTYANEQGSRGEYKLRPSGQMEFTSGPWKGFYGKTLDNGGVGLTSKPDGTFYQMVCQKR